MGKRPDCWPGQTLCSCHAWGRHGASLEGPGGWSSRAQPGRKVRTGEEGTWPGILCLPRKSEVCGGPRAKEGIRAYTRGRHRSSGPGPAWLCAPCCHSLCPSRGISLESLHRCAGSAVSPQVLATVGVQAGLEEAKLTPDSTDSRGRWASGSARGHREGLWRAVSSLPARPGKP